MTRDGTVLSGKNVFDQYFDNTLKEIEQLGLTPIVFSPTPSSGFNTGMCVEVATYFGDDTHSCDFILKPTEVEDVAVTQSLNRASALAKVVRLSDGICPGGVCKPDANGVFIYFDKGHLSHEGSRFLGKAMNWYSLITSVQPQNRPQADKGLAMSLKPLVSSPAGVMASSQR